jgi:hypothetical protein
MPTLRGKVSRQQFPSGQDGQVLVLDTSSPHGIAWRSGIDRLITDITPELSGDLDCNGYELTSVGNIGFSAVTGTLAGIQNQNLLDKTAAESIAGIYTHNANIVMADNSITGLDTLTFTDGAGTIAGVQNQNLLDKSATETVGGAWTYGSAIAMGTNKITGVGNPTAAQDASTKAYSDTQHTGYLCSSGVWSTGALGGVLGAGANFMPITAITSWTLHAPNNGWTESSSEFEFTGTYPASGTKTFLVQYAMSLQFYAFGTGATVSLVTKITKDTGGGYADVPGSLEVSDFDHYTTGFGAYFHFHSVSGSCIVSVDSGDTLAFNFGTFGFGSYTPVGYATTAGTEGVTLTITPIG